MNFFFYGKKENFVIMKVFQKEINGEFRKSFDIVFFKFFFVVFGNNNDMMDGDFEQIIVVIDKVDDVGEMLSQEIYIIII